RLPANAAVIVLGLNLLLRALSQDIPRISTGGPGALGSGTYQTVEKVSGRAAGSRALVSRSADLLADLLSLGVALLRLLDCIGRNAARPAVVLEFFDELGFCGQEILEQLAGFLDGCFAIVGLLDSHAVLLGFVAQRH